MRLLSKIAIAVAALASLSQGVAAQESYEQEKALITKVKRSPETYVFAEATCKTEEEAKAVAEDLFYQGVNEYVASEKKMQGVSDVVINNAQSLKNSVVMPRGSNMHRVFLYVKKSDILAVKNPVVMSERLKQMNEEEKDRNEAAAKARQEEKDRIGQEAEAKVRAEYEAKEQQRLAEELAKQKEDSIATALARQQEIPEAARKLAEVKTVAELNTALKQLKQSGEVTTYAKYKELTVNNEWYLILYDASGTVKAVLTDGDDRINVMTGQADSLKNYAKHAAIGVKFKK